MLEPIRNLNGLTAGELRRFLETVDDSAPVELRIPRDGIRAGHRDGEHSPILGAELEADWMIILDIEAPRHDR